MEKLLKRIHIELICIVDGRGNGKHGFSFSVDWKQWGVKRIKVETYSVDNSGYNPKVSSKIYTVE